MEELLNDPSILPPHPLEDLMKPETDDMSISDTSSSDTQDLDDDNSSDMDISVDSEDNEGHNELVLLVYVHGDATMVEGFVDDFMVLTNNNIIPDNLRIVSRAMLHGIHSVFPPPEITKLQGGDSVTIKKINSGKGHWEFIKEILGWIINGKELTVSLPESKKEQILAQIKEALKHDSIKLNDFQILAGGLQHASFAMPAGWGLSPPLSMAMDGSPKNRTSKFRPS